MTSVVSKRIREAEKDCFQNLWLYESHVDRRASRFIPLARNGSLESVILIGWRNEMQKSKRHCSNKTEYMEVTDIGKVRVPQTKRLHTVQ